VAVVHDRDGVETVTDLGLFPGGVAEQRPMGDELIRVMVGEDGDKRTLHLTARGGFIEAAHEGGEVIERIAVPQGDPVRAGDPAVHTGGD
jgi:hypothetical protein